MRFVTGIFRVGMAGIMLFGCVLNYAFAETAPSAGAGPKREHFAFASDVENLDGASLEALGTGKGCLPTTDSEGNLYLVCKYSTCRIRCVRADGRVETLVGDDRWPGNLKLDEGPASYFPNWLLTPQAGDYSKPGPIITVYGLPLNGEDQGRIYFFWPGQSPYKIFRNKEKGGRWWFRRLGAPGKAKPPATVGQPVRLDECDLTDARVGNGCIVCAGNVYKFDELKGEMTCMLVLSDYGPKLDAAYAGWASKGSEAQRPSKGPRPLEHVVRADDGMIYMLSFWYPPPSGVFQLSPDGSRCEHIVVDNSGRLKGTGVGANRDGPGLTTTWHCGPADISTSGNILFMHAIDSVVVRRWTGGRASTLCYDGEWRETPSRKDGGGPVFGKHHQPGVSGVPYIFITYPGEENGGDNRVYRFGPVDFGKPTVGPLTQVDTEKK